MEPDQANETQTSKLDPEVLYQPQPQIAFDQQNNSPLNQPSPAFQPVQKKKRKPVLLIVLLVILLLVCAALVYLYYTEKQAHDNTKQELSEALSKNEELTRTADLAPLFSPTVQEGANRECSAYGATAVLINPATSIEKNSNGSTKKYFGVNQYVCSVNGTALANPTRFSAAESYDSKTWSFTYGSSNVDPLAMPKYIYDTAPEMYSQRYPGIKPY